MNSPRYSHRHLYLSLIQSGSGDSLPTIFFLFGQLHLNRGTPGRFFILKRPSDLPAELPAGLLHSTSILLISLCFLILRATRCNSSLYFQFLLLSHVGPHFHIFTFTFIFSLSFALQATCVLCFCSFLSCPFFSFLSLAHDRLKVFNVDLHLNFHRYEAKSPLYSNLHRDSLS